MIWDRPPPERHPAIKAALADLEQLAKDMRKRGEIGVKVGSMLDNHCMLDLVLIWGSYGGKVPWPVTEPSLSVFKKHGIEDLIHPKPKIRHRAAIPPLAGFARTKTQAKKPEKLTFNDKLDHWAWMINESVTQPELTDVTRSEVRKALKQYTDAKGIIYIGKFLRHRGKYRKWIDSDDREGLAAIIKANRGLP